MRDDNWIQTFSGKQFWPLDPRSEDVDIFDIAHALSLLCRFTGHIREFYSVADHCLRVSKIIPPQDALWGLLHDASEAYLADLARPIKRGGIMGELYLKTEEVLQHCIAERFRLPWPMPDSVKKADNILLLTEQRDLLGEQVAPWTDKETPLPTEIIPLTPQQAERRFLQRFQQLHQQREDAKMTATNSAMISSQLPLFMPSLAS